MAAVSRSRRSLKRQAGLASSGSPTLNSRSESDPSEGAGRQRRVGRVSRDESLPISVQKHLSPSPERRSTLALGESPRLRRQSTVETKKVQKDEDEEKVNQYQILGKLGQGAFGVVREAAGSVTGARYAVKIMSKNRLSKIARKKMFGRPPPRGGPARSLGKPKPAAQAPELLQVKREIAILKNLDHPNIITLCEVIDDPDEDELYMVFELCEKGPVMNEAMDRVFDEETALSYFVDLMLGVEYLHSRSIIHRDIKPENLLLDDDEQHIKITDFGVSEWFSDLEQDNMLSKTAGSPAFMAPEAVRSDPRKQLEFAGKPADIWAMGVTLYCFIYGHLPFKSPNIIELYELIRTAEVQFPDDTDVSDELKDFLLKVLEKDPAKRLTIGGMRVHPWISDVAMPTTEDNCKPPEDVTEDEVAAVFSNLTISELCTVLTNIRTGEHQKLKMSRLQRSRSLDNHNGSPASSNGGLDGFLGAQSLSASLGRSSPLSPLESVEVDVDFSPDSSLIHICTSVPDASDGRASPLQERPIDFARLTPQQEDIIVRLSSPDMRRRSVGRWADNRSRSSSPMPRNRTSTGAPAIAVTSPPTSPAVARSASTPDKFSYI